MSDNNIPRLDRNFAKAGKLEEGQNNVVYWLTKSPRERLCAAYYLTCCAYGIEYTADHKLDRSVFSMRKHNIK